jgi:hypothetical protein
VSSSGGAPAGGLSRTTASLERDDAARERRGETAAALWVALAERVHCAPQRLPLGETEPAHALPNAWRASAGDLTPRVAAPGSSGDASADPKAAERLTLHVDGGQMGEVSVTLERQDGALRVVIGLENEGFVRSVAPDARALRSALESAGLSVHSLNIVSSSEVGTVLAQRRSSPSGHRPATDPEGSEQQQPETQKRNQKRLQLIG